MQNVADDPFEGHPAMIRALAEDYLRLSAPLAADLAEIEARWREPLGGPVTTENGYSVMEASAMRDIPALFQRLREAEQRLRDLAPQKYPVLVVCALIVRDGKVLLERHAPSEEYSTPMWDIPGGKVEIGESPRDAVVREIREEMGAGHIKLNLHRSLDGKINTVTIKREALRWFACFSVKREIGPLPASSKVVGIDVGLTAFAVLSDGTQVDNPRHYHKAQAKLRQCQRRVARRKKGSTRRRKAVLLLQRAHIHVKNQRADFQHKESRLIVNKFGCIVVEDLNVKGLASGMLAKSVHDAGWSQFLNVVRYKAEWAGREFVQVDPRGTSQTCVCGEPVPKTLKDRWHLCPACGLSANRDHMSAQVIKQRAGNRPLGANVEVVNSCVA
jgi:IS605 OrfB family transposase